MSFVCPSWLSFILYNPVRKLLTDRGRILDESGVTTDSVVLEAGAGNGFLTEVLVRRARKIIAVELQEGMVRKLKKRVPPQPGKVEIVKGDISLSPVEESIADVCILYYSFHEVRNREASASNICRILKKGGFISIYEPTLEVGEKAMKETVSMFEDLGCALELSRDGLLTRFARLRKAS
ncbi:MAG: class I SAM-dependent methyltransferase [Candidatus Sulfobium sp.]